MASPVSDDRQASSSAFYCATDTRYSSLASRVAALRRSSREIVDGSRPRLRAISRTQTSCAAGIASCSSSGHGTYCPPGSVNSVIDIPTPCRNRWAPTAGDTPTVSAAHSEVKPVVASPELAFDAALGCRCPPARSSWICQLSSRSARKVGPVLCAQRGDVLDVDGTEIIDHPYIECREALSSLGLNRARIKVPPYSLHINGPMQH